MVCADHVLQCGGTTFRFASALAFDLGAGLGLLARGQFIENGVEPFGREILVIVVVYLDHGRGSAIAHAFDLGEGTQAIVRDVTLAHATLLTGLEQAVGTAQHTGCRSANLNVVLTHGLHIIHEIEAGDFEYADDRHIEIVGDIFDHRANASAERCANPVGDTVEIWI